MNIVAKTTYGKFVMVCHGKFRDLSGVAVIKCKKASKKISANFNLADQVYSICGQYCFVLCGLISAAQRNEAEPDSNEE